MAGERVHLLNEAVAKFKSNVMEDITAARKIDVAVVEFNHAVWRHPFQNAEVWQPPIIQPEGGTCLSFGLKVAMDMVTQRKDDYRMNGISYYRPWIVLLTDGYPEHDSEAELTYTGQRVREAKDQKKFNLFTITCGEANETAIALLRDKITPPGRPPKKTTETNFSELFNWAEQFTYRRQPQLPFGPDRPRRHLGLGNSMKTAILAASVTRQGASHARKNSANEDSVYFEVLPSGRGIVAAVSDGAGSAPRAKEGSQLAGTYAVKRAFQAILEDEEEPAFAVETGLMAAREAIRQTAEIIPEAEMADYHCTLILVAWVDDQVAAVQVGDGAAIVELDGVCKMLTIPQRGEYVNETFFITEPHYQQTKFTREATGITALALFTDGLQKDAVDFQNRKANGDFIPTGHNHPAQCGERQLPAENDGSPAGRGRNQERPGTSRERLHGYTPSRNQPVQLADGTGRPHRG